MQRVAKALAAEISNVGGRLEEDVDQLGAPADREFSAGVSFDPFGRQVRLRLGAQIVGLAPVPLIELVA